MFALIGMLVVLGSVLGGFVLAGGSPAVLFALSEYIVIMGTAAGTVLIATPAPILKGLVRKLPLVFKGGGLGKELYIDALKLLYEMFQRARKDGLVAIEGDIEEPGKSRTFTRYPRVTHHEEAVTFLCDSLRLVLVGSVPPHDLEQLMEAEIDVHHEHEAQGVGALVKVGDAFPAIGIVAAVLGIVVTMQSLAGPIEEIGHHVASALVGTFLGVLLAYGFVHPVAASLENLNAEEARFLQFLKAAVIAFAKGLSPIVAVEFARGAIGAGDRPSFQEMEAACKTLKAKAES
jgi:chemotaxis protein MotA